MHYHNNDNSAIDSPADKQRRYSTAVVIEPKPEDVYALMKQQMELLSAMKEEIRTIKKSPVDSKSDDFDQWAFVREFLEENPELLAAVADSSSKEETLSTTFNMFPDRESRKFLAFILAVCNNTPGYVKAQLGLVAKKLNAPEWCGPSKKPYAKKK